MFPYGLSEDGRYLLPSGKYNDVTAAVGYQGVFGKNNLPNVVILTDSNTNVGVMNKNGAKNVIAGASFGVYDKCGAYNIEFGTTTSFFGTDIVYFGNPVRY